MHDLLAAILTRLDAIERRLAHLEPARQNVEDVDAPTVGQIDVYEAIAATNGEGAA